MQNAPASSSKQKRKRDIQSLELAITERRAVFFGGLPRYLVPKIIKKFFEELYGEVQELQIDRKRVHNKPDQPFQLHRGSGFVIFRSVDSIRHLQNSEYQHFDGHDIKVRVALGVKESRENTQKIREEGRKVHLTGFPNSIKIGITFKFNLQGEIKRMAQRYGTIEEISYIPVDKKGEPSCFIIYKERGIDKRLLNVKVKLREGVIGLLGPAYSPSQLKSHSTLKSSGKQTLSRQSSSDSLSDGFKHQNFRFNTGRGKGFFWVGGLIKMENPVGFKAKFREIKQIKERFSQDGARTSDRTFSVDYSSAPPSVYLYLLLGEVEELQIFKIGSG